MQRLLDGRHNAFALPFYFFLSVLTVRSAGAAEQDAIGLSQARTKITYFEPFNATVTGNQRLSIASALKLSKQRLDVTAFGETYHLELETNARVQAAAVDADGANRVRILNGALSNKAGSWVRLSFTGGDAEGLIWDGKDLYAVEPSSAVADLIPAPLTAPDAGNIIFRLSDTEINLGPGFCGSAADFAMGADGLAAYEILAGELKRMQIAALSATPTRGIEVSALGDASFRNQYASNADAQDAMLVRLNNVDGIFSAQTGVRIQTPSSTAYDTDPSQLSVDTDASTLLKSLADLRANTPALKARGLTHLFTGRNLQDNIVGIAYVGSLCDTQYAVGLTESRSRGAWLDSLIAAHEIGHNFGAIHDGVDACASTPLTYLMAAQLSGSSTFSQCSLDRILPKIQAAACLVSVATPNPAIPTSLSAITQVPGASFTWSLPVSNAGNADAQGVTLLLNLPDQVVMEQSLVSGGSCTSTSGAMTCTIDSIAAGDTRTISFKSHIDTTGTFAISAQLSAAADSDLSDNATSGSIVIEPGADLSISLNVPDNVNLNGAAVAAFKLSNLGASDAQNVTVTSTLPAGLTFQAIELSGASCAIQTQQAVCTLGSLKTDDAIDGQIRFLGAAEGGKQVQISASEQTYDPVASNNDATGTVQVLAAVTVTASSQQSGGGGGELGTDLIFVLASLGGAQRWRRHWLNRRSYRI